MSINYYCQENDPCSQCGRPYERKHIGRSVGGWCFDLHVYPQEGIHDLEDWKKLWQGNLISDEYGEIVLEEEMLRIITQRTWDKQKNKPYGYKSWEEFYKINKECEPGPNGLSRYKINNTDWGLRCISHGEGTWDCIDGVFS